MTPTEVAQSFVEAINSGDPDRMAEWMTEDHAFIDSDGTETSGREKMRRGWGEYFAMVPDFRIQVTDALSRGTTVALFGIAEGTFSEGGDLKSENHWSMAAAWRVVIEDELVAVWQLYVNPEPMAKILNRIQGT